MLQIVLYIAGMIAAAIMWAFLSSAFSLGFAIPVWLAAALALAYGHHNFGSAKTKHRIQGMRAIVNGVRSEGRLGHRLDEAGNDDVAALARDFNAMLKTLQSIIGQVVFNADQLNSASAEVASQARHVHDGTEHQEQAIEESSAAIEEVSHSIREVAGHAATAASLADQAVNQSVEGSHTVNDVADEISLIAESVERSATQVKQLGDRLQEIRKVIKLIEDIAKQTNLLALNAAIEAARAGQSGRGFAVVADEVRSLASRTRKATGEIVDTINAIIEGAEAAVSAIDDSVAHARSGAHQARDAAQMLDSIRQQIEETREGISHIAHATREQSQVIEGIASQVVTISSHGQRNLQAVDEELKVAERMNQMAGNLKEVGQIFDLGQDGQRIQDIHTRMPALVQSVAESVGKAFEGAVDSGRISMDNLFDRTYQPIPNTRPQKYRTASDQLADELLPSIQEPVLAHHPEVVYAITADFNGYVPTHNTKFCQPLTGNEQVDLLNNRTKRKFDDPVGKRVGSHEMPYLLQTYRRDTGEIIHDISAPIYVKGRHWGGFRIGYSTD